MSNTESQIEDPKSLDTASLKKFAQAARIQLLGIVESKLDRVLADDSMARRESERAVAELEEQIENSSREQVIERVAYTWFNRFCALRFMDVNRYTKLGSVSPAEGFSQPEILADAKQGVIDEDWKVDSAKVLGLLDGSLPSDDPQEEAYQLLLIGVCNSLNSIMPKMFQKIADYTELLIPDDLLSDSSILTATREALTPENCQNVEVIGWLYQFYISEKKDEVINRRSVVAKDEIPAATQLFTPHWIVRHLIENSLGQLWMLNHPDSQLVEQMDYYIQPDEAETDFLKIASPEDIKVCDPACGSGHMLTYAFDLLHAIYEEQGYQATDIPRLILTNNLFGIELDQRAGALAAFALTMKSREKYRRFLSSGKVVQPNICVLENISIDPEDLSAYMDKVGRDLFSDGLQEVVNQWEEADNFGSLIRPLATDVNELLTLLRERQMGEDLFLSGVHRKVLKALQQADYLCPKYHIVVANPPYAGSRYMNVELREFARSRYPDTKSDMFAMFIERTHELSLDLGRLAVVCPYVWMFISTYDDLRAKMLRWGSVSSLVRLEYNAFEPACVPVAAWVFDKASNTDGTFIDLSDFPGFEAQPQKTLEAIRNKEAEHRFTARTEDFLGIPGQPVAYKASSRLRELLSSGVGLGKHCDFTGSQNITGNNNKFVRFHWEVSNATLGKDQRWVPYAKGGGERKWYGLIIHVIDWSTGARQFYEENGTSNLLGEEYWFRPGVTYSMLTSNCATFRELPEGCVYDKGGPSFHIEDELAALALLVSNSAIAKEVFDILNPTLNLQVKDVKNLPFLIDDLKERKGELLDLAEKLIFDSRRDWESRETSSEFQSLPIPCSKGRLSELLRNYVASCIDIAQKTVERETQANKLLIDAYGLYEIDPTVKLSEVSLLRNPRYRSDEEKSDSHFEAVLLADTMREFISYSVGCMLGRYSLDKPGLILANQGETADDYRQQVPDPTFAPDEDNVIPLLDGDWFTDDISERFKEFLKVTFGTENYEENLTFLENSLYPANLEGKKRKTIRNYFLKEFYNHHIKLYKKRPIYWLFSSPKGTFNALIYMHRYQSDTVSVILNDYLREFMTKLRSKITALQQLADSGDAAKTEKTKALKEITKLNKQLKELEDYDRDVLFPLATKQVEIDLDDGVKVNYNKFGTALKKVTGLTGKA